MERRILVTFGLFIAFSFLLLYCISDTCLMRQKAVFQKRAKRFILILSGLLILEQTNQLAKLFYTDFKRYELDAKYADIINYYIKSEEFDYTNKPVIYVGAMDDYDSLPSQDPMSGYFHYFYGRGLEEINMYLRYFMDACGYKYSVIPERIQYDEAYLDSMSMPNFPAKGSVCETQDKIIVNLGSKPYIGSILETCEFVYGHRQDGWLEEKSEVRIRVYNTGKITLKGSYPYEISGNENIRIYINHNVVKEYTIDSPEFSLEFYGAPFALVTVNIVCDFNTDQEAGFQLEELTGI